MKNYLIYTFCLLQVALHAQDTIYKRNGEVIPAKIIEINISEISYKKSLMLDGPLFISDKSEIRKIKFFTGLVDSFTVAKTGPSPRITAKDQQYSPASAPNFDDMQLTLRRGTYLFLGRRISDRKVIFIVANKNFIWNNGEVASNVSEYKRNKTLQYVIGFGGGFLGGAGLLASVLGTESGNANDMFIAGVGAIVSAGVVVSSQVISYKFKLRRINSANRVAKLYNDLYKINYGIPSISGGKLYLQKE